MKRVLTCLFLIGLSLAGPVSASWDGSDYDWYGLLIKANPYAGCPTCVFAYDDDGLLDPNPYEGCPTCSFIFDTGIESDLNSPGSCPTCGTTQSSLKTGYSSVSISSNNAPGITRYSFANGTPIPADYVCPIHGIYCPDDPRPLEDRPGYADIVSNEKPARVSRTLPETTAEFMNLFPTAVSIPKTSRMDGILYRSR